MRIISDNLSAFPDRHYACLLADPPWAFKSWSDRGAGRSADRHYDTMSVDEICAMNVERLIARDAWLFLWITGPFAVTGAHVEVMRSWGFNPSALGFVWAKLQKGETEALFLGVEDSFHVGQGKTTRHNAELCFLGRRGSPPRLSADVRELIVSPLMEHSRKPIQAHERIERYCNGPRLEMFARRPPLSPLGATWDLFGNQIAS